MKIEINIKLNKTQKKNKIEMFNEVVQQFWGGIEFKTLFTIKSNNVKKVFLAYF